MTNKASLKSYGRRVLALLAAAGILYNSWPLGYLLDYATARHHLASDLEFPGHPYNWLFVLGDNVTAACILAAVLLTLYHLRRQLTHAKYALMSGLVLFAVGTAAAAWSPPGCLATAFFSCSRTVDYDFSLDTLTTSIAVLGFIVSLASAAVITQKYRALQQWVIGVFAAWCISSLWFLYETFFGYNAPLAQKFMLVLTGIGLALVGRSLAPGALGTSNDTA